MTPDRHYDNHRAHDRADRVVRPYGVLPYHSIHTAALRFSLLSFIKKETLYSVSFFMFCYASLALAMSHRAVNATASLMAISDSILRLISTPASFRPCMKVE